MMRRQCRVVYINHTARLSGGELALLRLLPHLDVDAHVILAEAGPLATLLCEAGVAVEVLPLDPTAKDVPRHGTRSLSTISAARPVLEHVRLLRRRLHLLKPDVVHTNSLKAAIYGGLAARAAGTPLLWHIRDRIAKDYLPGTAVTGIRMAARWLPQVVITNSSETLRTLHLPRDRGVVVHDCVQPSPLRLPEPSTGPLQVGMVGRLAPWKGQHVFLRAFERALRSIDAEAYIIGSAMFGEDDYAHELQDFVARVGIQDRVRFLGFMSGISAELKKFDVLVHASIIPEPFGQVVLEGMAAGLAVIASDGGGPRELITHGTDGLLTPPGDELSLADAIVSLGADATLRRKLGISAWARAGQFTPQHTAESVKAVYDRLLGDN